MPARFVSAIGSAWGRLAAALGAVLCLATAASQSSSGAQDVTGVRVGGDMTMTRVVVELNQSTKGRLLVAGGGVAGGRVVLALPGVSLDNDLQGGGVGLVSHWSVDSAAGAARVRLALSRPADVHRRFLLPPSDGAATYRYVIDLEPAPGSSGHPSYAAPRIVPASAYVPVRATLRARKVIVIDPGHGGRDPGAHGAMSREKDVNLAAARALRSWLEATGRYRVVMTRTSDVYVPLQTRIEIARRANADLFISLHSDSGPSVGVRGATVYTLSDKGSERVVHGVTDRTDWLIAADLPGQTQAVSQILRDLTQRATRNQSDAFAEAVLDHIADRAQARASHRDAGFMVLLAPDVPAVLLEMGYINNAADERMLNSPAQREHFMAEVGAAIDGYFHRGVEVAALR